MLAVAPRLFISYFGVQRAILTGMFFFALGLAGAGLAPTPGSFIFSIFIVSIGCICLPALQSVMANSAKPSQRGAVLGAIGSLTELTAAIGSTLYAGILAKSTAQDAIFGGRVPGMHFLCASLLLMVTWGFSMKSLVGQNHPAVSDGISDEDMDDELFALD
jgi:MFS family permease